VSATSVGASMRDTTEHDLVERPPWQRGRGGTALGRAVHAVLQSVDVRTGEGIEATARAQALAEGIVEREAEIAALARSALDAPTIRGALARQRRLLREMPVTADIGGVLVEGFVDLLVEEEGGLVIVDYKTDHITDDALDARVLEYRGQGAAYALALETVLGRPVERMLFVFVRATGAVERELPDLRGAIAELVDWLSATS
jgi:ATP-dependent helicase/nuclease subunit A